MAMQSEYIRIKERLDAYNLPSNFSLQCMGLLSSLLLKLDEQRDKMRNQQIKNFQGRIYNQLNQNIISEASKMIDKTLKSQLSKSLNENNQLHLDIIILKQELQSAKHCLDKVLIEKSDNKTQISQIIRFKNEKQKQLASDLEVAKFKYNQLLDFIHEQDNLERMYIKRLLKHKKYENTNQNQNIDQNHNHSKHVNRSMMSIHKHNSSKKSGKDVNQSRSRISKTIDQNPKETKSTISDQERKIQQLSFKLQNREKEISRLHAKVQFNGVDVTMDKALRNFQVQQSSKAIIQLKNKIEMSEFEYNKMKQQVQRARKTGGRYQALRQQVEKCHEIIKNLKKQNKKLAQNINQKTFDSKKEQTKLKRQAKNIKQKSIEMNIQKMSNNYTISDLTKKVHFYQKQFKKSTKTEDIKTKGQSDFKPSVNKSHSLGRQKYENQISLSKNKSIQEVEQESSGQQKISDDRYRLQLLDLRGQYQIKKQEVRLKDEAIQNLQRIIDKLMGERNEQKKKQKNQVKSTNENGSNYNSLMRQKQSLKMEFGQLNKTLGQYKHLLNNKQQQVRSYHNDIRQLNRTKAQLQSSLNQSQFQKQELRRQFIDLDALHRQKERQLSGQSKQLERKVIDLEQKLLIKQKALLSTTQFSHKQQSKLKQFIHKIKQLNDQIEQIQQQKHKYLVQINVLKLRTSQFYEQLQIEKEKYQKLLKLSQIQKEQIIMLKKKTDHLDDKVIKYVEQLQESRSQISRYKQRIGQKMKQK